jgi:hypothetical protein
MAGLTFDPESSKHTVHSTQSGLDNIDLLGRAITVIIHPLLEAYESALETKDEDYNVWYVLILAEVWVKSRQKENN